MSNIIQTETFKGFDSLNYTLVPKAFVDHFLPLLKGKQINICLYIISHTYGWKKYSDKISLSQFQKGIKKKDGVGQHDYGCGITNMNTLIKNLKQLDEMKIIRRVKRFKNSEKLPHDKVKDTTEYSLNLNIDSSTTNGIFPWKRSSFFQVPSDLLNKHLRTLNGNQLKVLLYVSRWTSHLEGASTTFSTEDLIDGIRDRNGVCLSNGCGITDKDNLRKVVNSLCQLHFLYKKRNYHQSNGNAPSTYSLFEIENDQVENDSTPQVKNNNTYQVKIDSRDQVINDSTVEVKKHIGVGVKTNSTLEVETDTYTTKAKTILAQTKESYNTTGWSDEIFAYFFKKLKLKHGQPRLEKEYATFCQLPKTVLDIENQKKIVDRFVNDHQDTHSFSRFLSYCAPYVRAVESELENIQLRAQNQKLLEKSQKEIMRQKSDRIDSENEKYAKFQALPELERKRLLKGHGAGWQSEKARWRMYSQTVKKQKPKKASEHNVTPITKDIQQTLLF